MESLIGKSAVTIQTDKIHQNRRKILKKSLLLSILRKKIAIISQITAKHIEKSNKLVCIYWYTELQDYSFDLACKLFVGIDKGSPSELGDLDKIWNEGLFSFAPPVPWTKLSRAIKSRDKILAVIDSLIQERKQENS